MYGLEKNPKPIFEMDLEKDIKKNPQKVQELTKNAEKRIQEIKEQLRGGQASSEFDSLGALLHGYTALLKIVNRLAHKK